MKRTYQKRKLLSEKDDNGRGRHQSLIPLTLAGYPWVLIRRPFSRHKQLIDEYYNKTMLYRVFSLFVGVFDLTFCF